MFNRLGRIIFTSTAIAPVGFTYAFAVATTKPSAALIAVCVSLALWAFAWAFIDIARKDFEKVAVKPTAVEAADKENIAYLLLYLSPLFTSAFTDLNWSVILPTVLIFGAVTATGYNYHHSPLLGLMGWHAYRITDHVGVTYVVFTRRQLRSAIDPLITVQVTEYVLVDTQE